VKVNRDHDLLHGAALKVDDVFDWKLGQSVTGGS